MNTRTIRAISHTSRLYQAVVSARDELGITRDEFKRTCERRPEYYGPVAYLADCDTFWENAKSPSSPETTK